MLGGAERVAVAMKRRLGRSELPLLYARNAPAQCDWGTHACVKPRLEWAAIDTVNKGKKGILVMTPRTTTASFGALRHEGLVARAPA